MKKHSWAIGFLAGLLGAAPLASAGMISQVVIVPGTIIKSIFVITTAPNVVTTPPTQNDSFLMYRAVHPGTGSVDVLLKVVATNGTTGYELNLSPYNSSTTDAITCYRLQLGFGTGTDFIQLAEAGLAFAQKPDGTSLFGFYPTQAPTSGNDLTLEWLGNILVNPRNGSSIYWQLAVPDIDTSVIQTLPGSAQVAGQPTSYYLTLRQTVQPNPEPASLALLSLGVCGLLGRRPARRG